jgi:hypothetical protein
MKTKQTNEEISKILGEVIESLKPAQLVLMNEARKDSALVPKLKLNVRLIDAWLEANCVGKDGVVDYSFRNLRKGISALKGQLSWMIAPQTRGASGVQGENNKPTRERGFVDATATRKIIQDAANKQAAERDASVLRSVEAFCRAHTSHPHSRTFKERDQLQAEFKRLIAQKLKPAEIDTKIRAMAASFFKGR